MRYAVWTLLTAAVVLATRAIVYALAPTQTLIVAKLEHKSTSQATVVLAGIGLLAAALGTGVAWLAVVAVRERLALEPRELIDPPRLRITRLAARTVALFGAASLVFGLLESYVHWRAGLGWHGLHCVVGPVHREAIPVLAGLSLLAVAAHGAVEHLLAWARRLVAFFAPRLPLLRGQARIFSSTARPRPARVESEAAPRGPPAWALH
jgi:hypothetical protein